MRIAVIGGAGGMGRLTSTDAARSPEVDEVVIVDRDLDGAQALASVLGEKARVAAAGAGFAEAIDGCDAVVNAASHSLNLAVMRAALDVGVHYTDLGGLFHVALEQYSLDDDFRSAGLSAAISMGSAPGVTNMLAAACAERLETVESIEIADAIIPGREPDPTQPYVPPYAASTLVDEFTMPAAVFLEGEMRMVPADTGGKVYEFPDAAVECIYTIHSEPATLSRSYADRGIRRVEWRLGLPPIDVLRLRSFIAGGLTSTEPVDVGGTPVVPREALIAVLMNQGGAEADPGMVEYLRVLVEGRRAGGEPASLVAEMKVVAREEWENDISYVTGVPPSVAAQLLCRGVGLRTGVGGPEAMLPVEAFFGALRTRGLEASVEDAGTSTVLGA